jgi:hypothetical protein
MRAATDFEFQALGDVLSAAAALHPVDQAALAAALRVPEGARRVMQAAHELMAPAPADDGDEAPGAGVVVPFTRPARSRAGRGRAGG